MISFHESQWANVKCIESLSIEADNSIGAVHIFACA